MENYIFFDKRYTKPFSFEGELIFSDRHKDFEIKIFKLLDDNYVFAYQGKINTELYLFKDDEDLINFLLYGVSIYIGLNFLKKNYKLIDEYSSTPHFEHKTPFFYECYKIYKFSTIDECFHLIVFILNNELFTFIKNEKNTFNMTSEFYKWMPFDVKKFIFEKDSDRLYFLRGERFLNKEYEGSKVISTGIVSLKNGDYINLYGIKKCIIKSKGEYNILLIKSVEGYYLIVNNIVYFDVYYIRLLLCIPDNIFLDCFEKYGFTEKSYIFTDNNDGNVFFSDKKYKELPIPIEFIVHESTDKYLNTNSQFLSKNYKMYLGNGITHAFHRKYSCNLGNCSIEEFEFLKKYNNNIINHGFRLATNGKILISKEFEGLLYSILKIKDYFLVTIESEENNSFFFVYKNRFLFLLVESGKIPFTYEELIEIDTSLNPITIDKLMEVGLNQ